MEVQIGRGDGIWWRGRRDLASGWLDEGGWCIHVVEEGGRVVVVREVGLDFMMDFGRYTTDYAGVHIPLEPMCFGHFVLFYQREWCGWLGEIGLWRDWMVMLCCCWWIVGTDGIMGRRSRMAVKGLVMMHCKSIHVFGLDHHWRSSVGGGCRGRDGFEVMKGDEHVENFQRTAGCRELEMGFNQVDRVEQGTAVALRTVEDNGQVGEGR